ncbi:MAG TPA: acylphosphatase [Casimicrobiaceae bacterium]|nr:acylphosphatase [Casimicrobiaceae bacterium]
MTQAPGIARRLLITGRVQGVGYRFAFADEARELRLQGWVRNRRDGSVEAIVAGPAAHVEAMIAWAHRGPPAARVAAVSVEIVEGEFSDFDIAPTA